ncbi:hypothetical protein [Streptomyces odontomachi]|uniref:hypothetical protein n=1 Tax=Streptomyces odontomachi TaxID=2944940 RepID=UPI00210D612E|nr:hypothetical protein [Streptomyces sp. ODS25]
MHVSAGQLIGTDAVINCPHGGRVTAVFTPASDAVLLDGRPVATDAGSYAVTGCTHTVNGTPSPCTEVRWTADRDGVLVDGVPVLLDITRASCVAAHLVPQGRPVVAPVRRGVSAG